MRCCYWISGAAGAVVGGIYGYFRGGPGGAAAGAAAGAAGALVLAKLVSSGRKAWRNHKVTDKAKQVRDSIAYQVRKAREESQREKERLQREWEAENEGQEPINLSDLGHEGA